jgi:hypothetical protein
VSQQENVRQFTRRGLSARGVSIFRRVLAAEESELAQALDERRAAQVEEARGMRHDAVAPLERLLDERALDRGEMGAQIQTFGRERGEG